jgi:hypothetical protein
MRGGPAHQTPFRLDVAERAIQDWCAELPAEATGSTLHGRWNMAATTPGLLLVMTNIPAEIEGEVNDWYDTEHIPERLAIPGFVGAQRYRAVEGGPAYQALYDLESVAVLDTPEYVQLRENQSEQTLRIMSQLPNLQRSVYTQIHPKGATAEAAPVGTGALLLVGIAPPPGHEEEFEAWYDTEHIPRLAAVPGVLRARRFAPVDGSNTYLAVYELADPDVPATEAWANAADTPWTLRQRSLPRQVWLRVRSRALVPAKA